MLVNFWASWCIPCRAELPLLKNIYQKYSSKPLQMIFISIDKDDFLWRKAIKDENIGMHINGLITQQLREIFFVPSIPMTYLLDENNKIIGRWRGQIQDGKEIEMILNNQ